MADGFELTPATLTGAAGGLDSVQAQLRGRVDDVATTATSANPWGSDEPGSLFGGLYTAVVGHAVTTLGTHVEQLGYAADSLRAWVDSHSANDEAVAARLRGLAP